MRGRITRFGAGLAAAAALAAPAAADASVGNFGMAVQRDGKIVVAGGAGLAPEGGSEFAAVVRYLPNGKLDRSFGGGDGVILDRSLEPFTAVALQRDGRIVLTAPIGEVVRLLPDGRFDGNFGVRGRKSAGVESSWFPRTVAIGGDGGIFVGGMTGYPQDTGENWYGRLYRVAPSGQEGGWVGAMTSGEGGGKEPPTVINDIVLGAGGSVIGAGNLTPRDLHPKRHAVLARLVPGTTDRGYPSGPDPTFGGGAGLVQGNFLPASPEWEAANALAWDKGKLLIAGQVGGDLLVSRYFKGGTQDNGFGRRGFWTVTVGRYSSEVANAVAVDAKGAIFAAGSSTRRCGSGECSSLLLARFGPDGHPVTGFGHGGVVTPSLGSGASGSPAFETAYEVGPQPRGRVLVGGLVGGPSSTRFFLRRYLTTGRPDPSFGNRGRVTTLPVAVRSHR